MARHKIFEGCWRWLALGVLGWVVLAAIAPARAGAEEIYTSRRYGYGFRYPADCGLKAAAEGAYVDLSYQGRRLPSASVQSLDETGKEERKGSPDPWKEFMLEQAKLSCDADGPDGTVYCQGVEEERTWKTTSGLRVLELCLRRVEKFYGPPEKVTVTKVGPIYAVDISRKGHVFGLLVGSGHDFPQSPAQNEVIRKIVASVYLIPESEFQPPKPRLVGPGPLFEGRPGRALMPVPGK